eukprot:CAMPEP_0174259116 /NCGR_PEP_ID=MMETSP0439-20130205/7996_1 /TAXON_ID=0 /ORGANISM="Stereomyxa ramosa, Strain Chinc5" /LENGTH=247 /DNA_ID=CAMNT_0015342891 /DNA_START=63 /DNA_END=803 /DNA_ORIENTATION=+
MNEPRPLCSKSSLAFLLNPEDSFEELFDGEEALKGLCRGEEYPGCRARKTANTQALSTDFVKRRNLEHPERYCVPPSKSKNTDTNRTSTSLGFSKRKRDLSDASTRCSKRRHIFVDEGKQNKKEKEVEPEEVEQVREHIDLLSKKINPASRFTRFGLCLSQKDYRFIKYLECIIKHPQPCSECSTFTLSIDFINDRVDAFSEPQQRVTPRQGAVLEQVFMMVNLPSVEIRRIVANRLGMSEEKVKVW